MSGRREFNVRISFDLMATLSCKSVQYNLGAWASRGALASEQRGDFNRCNRFRCGPLYLDHAALLTEAYPSRPWDAGSLISIPKHAGEPFGASTHTILFDLQSSGAAMRIPGATQPARKSAPQSSVQVLFAHVSGALPMLEIGRVGVFGSRGLATG